ncbi:MAG TPA: patatin-like phospholipase family protein, partial [Longimicrobium sp.]|nr:patatin-like phospholipase family protein [Longimicrobium sp.]
MADPTVPGPPPPDQARPLGNLALSLSGGGYRAAAFHLGSMRLMDRVGLLPGVVGLSTVSGGSIVGMAWVVSMLDGKPFSQFHDEFSRYLVQNNVIAEALEGLTGDRRGGGQQWASLIRAAADVYARPNLFGDRRFAEVLGARGLQLEEAIFNSTEFHTGRDFRFRRSENAAPGLENPNYHLPRSVAMHLRMADIVAASQCFPGGYEPLVFPQDFRWTPSYPLQSAIDELGPKFKGGLPLMDGGIYDNQGMESLLLAFEGTSATTLMISDVSSRVTDIYDVPPNPASRGHVTLKGVERLGFLLFLLALAAFVVLGWNAVHTARAGDWGPTDYLLYLVPGLLAAGTAGGLAWLRHSLKQGFITLRKTIDTKAWPSLSRLTVPEFTQMMVLRITSLLALTSGVFMERIRGLVYGMVASDADFKGRTVRNLIYALELEDPAFFREHRWLEPSPGLVELSQSAQAVPTTLWFTGKDQFDALEACGQATACYVLLRHIVEDRRGQYEAEGSPLHDLFTRLRAEWEAFNTAPPRPTTPPAAPAAPATVSL